MFREEIKKSLLSVLEDLSIPVSEKEIVLEHPVQLSNGDYSINSSRFRPKSLVESEAHVALLPSVDLAQKVIARWNELGFPDFVEKVEVAGPGFINMWLKIGALSASASLVLAQGSKFGTSKILSGKKIMVEYAHPNTHKELHIGHMRTLITGEALSRIFAAAGAKVFRANYQGDIGPHVAKSIWGTEKLLKERKTTWEEAEKLSLAEKAHLLGEGYVLGVREYVNFKEEIDDLNTKIYNRFAKTPRQFGGVDEGKARFQASPETNGKAVESLPEKTLGFQPREAYQKDPAVLAIYEHTRRWSLEYYDTFYTRFGTKFDQLFFESEVAESGKKIVKENVGRVFTKSEGAIIFDGEKYGLHKRVFITADGNPTYEAKDMGLAYRQFEAFPFDLNVHVVANEQLGYFQVMIKALERLDPYFKDREYHLPMGMVNLVSKKMSSRTGEILRVDDLFDEVKNLLRPLVKEEKLSAKEKEKILEVATIAAVKYSVLRVGPKQDVVFDPEKSVSLQGDSGPYLEYTLARTQSVLRKVQGDRKSVV